MKAALPVVDGVVERDGVRLHWEQYGDGDRTIALLPTWSIVDSRHWKFQVPYLARHHRVIVFDGRGCGRSDRPVGAAAYTPTEFVADTLAVLDATGTERAVLVGFSRGALWELQIAADHPGRVLGLVTISPGVPLVPYDEVRNVYAFDEHLEVTEGWAKFNGHYWQRDYNGFLEFFFGRMFTEPHSTKRIEDCIGWGLGTDAATLVDTHHGVDACGEDRCRAVCGRVRQPLLVIHGDQDAIRPHAAGAALAELTGGTLVTVAGGGHAPHCRDPIQVNRLIKRFVDRIR
jgi:pimeloyl-ACP methyl ester carboxylesterase